MTPVVSHHLTYLAREKQQITISNAQRRQQGEDLILRVAEEVFAKHGFHGATVTEIGKCAGLPKANIHYYFSSKEKLYQRVLEDVIDLWLEASQQFEDFDDPAKSLTAYINAKMDLSRTRPNGSKVWANEVARGGSRIQTHLNTRLKQWVESREVWINRWIERGQMRPVNAKYLLYMIWASTQHYADFDTQIIALNNNKPLSDEQFEEAKSCIVEVILKGVVIYDNP